MPAAILVPEKPCESCPYAKRTPPGIWHKSEYQKLPEYDDNPPSGMQAFGIFLCHHSPSMNQEAVCRGWLSVHCQSVAVRLAMMRGTVTPEQVYAEPLVELYATGHEAAAAGIAGIRRPSKAARAKIQRLEKQQARRK